MTKIEIQANTKKYYITAYGHAGYGEYGSDIVCAGITSLIYAFIETVENEEECKYTFTEGYFAAECKKNKNTKNYVKMLICGLLHIQRNFPENIKIKLINN